MEDHFLLILADSQLPIGSFAYSSGLESCSIHNPGTDVADFLKHSIDSLCHTTIPFIRAAYTDPRNAVAYDDTFDANTPCQVARRASLTQGRALLKLIVKTFLQHCGDEDEELYKQVLAYKAAVHSPHAAATGHFGVVSGLAGRVLGIGLDRLTFAFLQSHAKAVLSAAVRLSLIGPYESTHLLASKCTRQAIQQAIEKTKNMGIDDCGQTFSIVDVWQGRHELLYSRIFSA
ncbi:Putative uncharacterized protein [Taphrina deformans PYCC 5710]|uniref:Urease accessory protein UreF n=1 Tax=Taphrina deformans (strain PYCC 5710 / ATCC 11124 / CBS 356.35 / IMI 108563 / JCM 9778 / NBRC 8474) TaxID=1097556 RepID=R4XEH5_TAPDE|nr:Putative uncharacterized protein [Taphrina deformans PYCC 5710]|eukprot:CCG81772.1 Putative uncharacterized protein [Taphrina deformans PYCC 5710]